MNRIRKLRKQKNITQKELAKYLQIADSTLSYWEMGKYEPDIDALKNLSKFFNVTIDYIVGDGSNMETSEHKATYADKGNHDNALFVSEPEMIYGTSHMKNELNRYEFNDLTAEEIEKLAEYALFIKSLRIK
jgi:transcriptional regulator with XRE-family HTH domain